MGITLLVPVINSSTKERGENNTGARLHVDLNFAHARTHTHARARAHTHTEELGAPIHLLSGSFPTKGNRRMPSCRI
jgi:hypothetical protein